MNILLADDHTLFRESLAFVLKATFSDSRITSVESWPEVLAHLHDKIYDLFILDLFMGDDISTCWTSSLKKVVDNQVGVICIVSASNNRSHIQSAFHIGASGYICKTATLKEMQKALNLVSEGKTYLPEQLLSKTFQDNQDKRPSKITWRQQEVLQLLTAGDSNKVIAQKLRLSESTIKRHVSNMYRTLAAKNRADAIRIARSKGILSDE